MSPIVDDVDVNHITHVYDWFHHSLHQTHEFEPHPYCGDYISAQFLTRGASTFKSPGEVILPKPYVTYSCVDPSTIILPHLEEPLESHVTPNHHGDDPLNHPSVLHQHPSPLYIIVVQPPCHLGEH